MGPKVKFVSAITDAFSNKKMGVNFFPQKRPNRGGRGVRGRFGKRPYFCRIFFNPSLIDIFHKFFIIFHQCIHIVMMLKYEKLTIRLSSIIRGVIVLNHKIFAFYLQIVFHVSI